MKFAAAQDFPAQFRTRAFLELRNQWYRKLEGEGHEIDENGYKNGRERAKKGVRLCGREYLSDAFQGKGEAVWDAPDAEYWRLIAAQVEALPNGYRGKAFLRRWAEIGDVKNAARQTGVSRWDARKVQARFLNELRRKGVLK